MFYANQDFAQLLAALVHASEDTNLHYVTSYSSLCPTSEHKMILRTMNHEAQMIASTAVWRDSSS